MNKFKINRYYFSDIFWRVIFEHIDEYRKAHWRNISRELEQREASRQMADYNTGTITHGSAFSIFALCSYFSPSIIGEVGTFIGRSTLSMARGCEAAKAQGVYIHTCDYSNDIDLGLKSTAEVIQYKRTSSEMMFSRMEDLKQRPDLLLLDGRLGPGDAEIMRRWHAHSPIVVLDDFEGVEKGVANVFYLSQLGYMKSHFLIYPPTRELLAPRGFLNYSTVGVLIPKTSLSFVAQ
jgi:hypothetical protein